MNKEEKKEKEINHEKWAQNQIKIIENKQSKKELDMRQCFKKIIKKLQNGKSTSHNNQ